MLKIIIVLIVIFNINCDCENSYYFNQSTTKCQQCQSGCSSCQNSYICFNCHQNYFLSSTVCIRCSQQCKQCTSATRCSICNLGYRFNLISQSCLPCPNNCNSCKVNNGCEICKIGYFIKNNNCVKCDSNCKCVNGIDQICDQNDVKNLVVYITISILTLLILIGCFVCYRQNCKRAPINPNNSNEQISKIIQSKPKNFIRLNNQNTIWKQSKTINFKQTCSICLDDFVYILTQCGHLYHQNCLKMWVLRQSSCPLCKWEIEIVKKYCKKCYRKSVQINIYINKEILSVCTQCQRNQTEQSFVQMIQ